MEHREQQYVLLSVVNIRIVTEDPKKQQQIKIAEKIFSARLELFLVIRLQLAGGNQTFIR